jgi:hypothetical protein
MNDKDAQKNLEFWVARHFGDTTPGAATKRFHAAVESLLAAWQSHALIHEGDARSSESDPLDDDEDDEDTAPSDND